MVILDIYYIIECKVHCRDVVGCVFLFLFLSVGDIMQFFMAAEFKT